MCDSKRKVWLITWKYLDDSSFGVVGVYDSQQLMQYDLDLLNEHGNPAKSFYTDKKELIGA